MWAKFAVYQCGNIISYQLVENEVETRTAVIINCNLVCSAVAINGVAEELTGSTPPIPKPAF
jgi:hypothetical protein